MKLTEVVEKMQSLLAVARKPVTKIPVILEFCSLAQRPGLSVLVSAANVIKSQANFGAPTGTLPDGTPNLMNQFIINMFSETYRALREDCVGMTSGPPGCITIGGVGGGSNQNYITELRTALR